MESTPGDLGARVRAARRRRRFTLRQLSDATGLSESFLSQFERGLSQASIASLRSITSALGISVGDLFDVDGGSGVRVLRASARPRLPFGDNAVKFLLTPKPLDSFEVLHVTFEVNGSTGAAQYTHGDDDELVLVQEGAVKLELGEDVFLLEQGDSLVFRSSVPHRILNVSPQSSSVLWIIGAAGH